MAKNINKNSQRVASSASKTLRILTASKTAKSLAGSALSQSGTQKQTGASMEGKASKVLSSGRYTPSTKAFAGSVVSQSNKKR